MANSPISDIAFTPTVKAVQERLGSRRIYTSMEQKGGWKDEVTDDLAEFIAERDTLFIATVSADGQPYMQHRGGPPGFLKVLDDFCSTRISFWNYRKTPAGPDLTAPCLNCVDHPANQKRDFFPLGPAFTTTLALHFGQCPT